MKKIKLVLLTVVMAVCAVGAKAEDLNMKVPPGYRATVVQADKAEFLFIKPGDRLDMLVTFDAQMKDNTKEKVTASILQNVLVLDTVCKDGVYAVVLALNPNEAQYAMLSLGYQVHFTIRGKGDTEMHPMEMASFRRLIKGDSDEKTAKKEEPAKPADK
jgi:Flp pilus assembly protein CpaB